MHTLSQHTLSARSQSSQSTRSKTALGYLALDTRTGKYLRKSSYGYGSTLSLTALVQDATLYDGRGWNRTGGAINMREARAQVSLDLKRYVNMHSTTKRKDFRIIKVAIIYKEIK